MTKIDETAVERQVSMWSPSGRAFAGGDAAKASREERLEAERAGLEEVDAAALQKCAGGRLSGADVPPDHAGPGPEADGDERS